MPFFFRSPKIKTPVGSFGFFHIFGKGRRASRPTLTCQNCGYSWQPRGKNYALKCPNCKASQVTQQPGGGESITCLPILITLLAIPAGVFVCCGGAGMMINSANSVNTAATNKPSVPLLIDSQGRPEAPDKPSAAEQPVVVDSPPPADPLPMPDPPPDKPKHKYELRTWRSGRHSATASFVSYNAGEVVLRKEDGSEVSIDMKTLSQDDQTYVQAILRRGK